MDKDVEKVLIPYIEGLGRVKQKIDSMRIRRDLGSETGLLLLMNFTVREKFMLDGLEKNAMLPMDKEIAIIVDETKSYEIYARRNKEYVFKGKATFDEMVYLVMRIK